MSLPVSEESNTEEETTRKSSSELENQATVCCLHGAENEGNVADKILCFSDISFSTCQHVLKTRKLHHLKHSNIELPQNIPSKFGYHHACYKRFIGLSEKYRVTSTSSGKKCDEEETSSTRSTATHLKTSKLGIFPRTCLICNKSRKKRHNVEQKLVEAQTNEIENSIKKYAGWLQDDNMLRKISGVDFVAKEIVYHAVCRKEYQAKAEATCKGKADRDVTKQSQSTEWHQHRKVYSQAYEIVQEFIEEKVCVLQEVHYLNDVSNLYHAAIKDIGGEGFEEAAPTTQKLQNKLLETFAERICVTKSTARQGNIIYNSSQSMATALHKQYSQTRSRDIQMRDVAFMLREEILRMEKKSLPDNITVDDIVNGTGNTPAILEKFLHYLIGGPKSRSSNSEVKKRRIKSIGEDVVFATSSGRKIPGKHLKLGIAVKSLTGSRKLIEMLNRYGHCANYHMIEEVETEMTYEASKSQTTTPSSMHFSADRGIGCAFDNYDCFVETQNGKDTLHDTVGITYEVVTSLDENEGLGETGSALHGEEANCIDDLIDMSVETAVVKDVEDINPAHNLTAGGARKKRRRTFESTGLDIAPYYKKPRVMKSNLLPLNDPKRRNYNIISEEEADAWKKDILWMTDMLTDDDASTPMFVGWNAQLLPRDNEVQKVVYLPQINLSPTSHAVVQETMNRALRIAGECGKTSIVVTYDLAIAKMAMHIQEEESPKFENVFVALGTFHLELAMLKAIGSYIAESGGPHVLNECEVLAKGSTKSFQSGKSYKRCKKVHELLALAMETLHFNLFISNLENGEDVLSIINDELKELKREREKEEKSITQHTLSKDIENVLAHYKLFVQDTAEGKIGKTAQYWINYVNMVHLYHQLSRSVRIGDFELFTNSLPRITNLFFAFNQPNYARWTVKYHDNLLKLPESHPEVYSEFKRKLFGIQRTTKPFSRTPIDLTLEQTINADAASQRTGISAMTNSIGARQRWAQSHFLRIDIISKINEDLGLTRKEDVSADLKKNRIKKDHGNLKKVLAMVEETMNPFNVNVDQNHLFNIGTGKCSKIETADFLLNVLEIGNKGRVKFIEECIQDPSRFENPIKRQKVATFATESGLKKLKSKDGKVVAACLMRDLFGSILCLSLEKKIDMDEVLSYPLTPVPLSLCNVDETKLTTPKSALMAHLEERIISVAPPTIDAQIIDAAFFLHLYTDLPAKFGGVARFLLRKILKREGQIIHFVTDKWITPSIKDSERDSRNAVVENFNITGSQQSRPGNWMSALRNGNFKTALIKFLVDNWKDDEYASLFDGKVLYVNSGNKCYSFKSVLGKVIRTEEFNLYSDHEEADSRMFHHMQSLPKPSNVVVRSNDTDVLVIAIGCRSKIDPELKIWLEAGVQGKNNLRFISVDQICSNLGETLCHALPAYFAFTGCDYSAAFSRKGKVTPFKKLEKDEQSQIAFGRLADASLDELATIFLQIEKFTSLMGVC